MIHLEGCYCRELGDHETYLPAGEATPTRGAKGKTLSRKLGGPAMKSVAKLESIQNIERLSNI